MWLSFKSITILKNKNKKKSTNEGITTQEVKCQKKNKTNDNFQKLTHKCIVYIDIDLHHNKY